MVKIVEVQFTLKLTCWSIDTQTAIDSFRRELRLADEKTDDQILADYALVVE